MRRAASKRRSCRRIASTISKLWRHTRGSSRGFSAQREIYVKEKSRDAKDIRCQRRGSFASALLQRRFVVDGRDHGRAVMHHHVPLVAYTLEDVGAEHSRALRAVVAALGQIFFDDHD